MNAGPRNWFPKRAAFSRWRTFYFVDDCSAVPRPKLSLAGGLLLLLLLLLLCLCSAASVPFLVSAGPVM